MNVHKEMETRIAVLRIYSITLIHKIWIPRFVTEVRNKKGEPYPPRSIHLLLAGLQRYMFDKNLGSPKFLNRSESAFRDILTIDCCMEYNYCIECLFYYNFCDWELYIFPS